jgi:hypothetical protein
LDHFFKFSKSDQRNQLPKRQKFTQSGHPASIVDVLCANPFGQLRQSLANFGKVWPILAKFGQFWQSWPILAKLANFGKVWPILAKFGGPIFDFEGIRFLTTCR